jgi:hypothetical protein
VKECVRCHRKMRDNEVTRTFHISEFYVCRNFIDCQRASKCKLCETNKEQLR